MPPTSQQAHAMGQLVNASPYPLQPPQQAHSAEQPPCQMQTMQQASQPPHPPQQGTVQPADVQHHMPSTAHNSAPAPPHPCQPGHARMQPSSHDYVHGGYLPQTAAAAQRDSQAQLQHSHAHLAGQPHSYAQPGKAHCYDDYDGILPCVCVGQAPHCHACCVSRVAAINICHKLLGSHVMLHWHSLL